MTARRTIVWSQALHDASRTIAAEAPPPAAPSVKERAQEFLDHARPGQRLEAWQVDIAQMLRSRLTPSEVVSHGVWLAAFNAAWEAGQ